MTAEHSPGDWCTEMFPGEGLELPTPEERDLADVLIEQWNARWGEQWPAVPRVHPMETDEGFANFMAGDPTNRAYLRCHLRRWWRHPTGRPVRAVPTNG